MTPLIFLLVVMLPAGPGLLFGYRTLRNKDRAAGGRTVLCGVLTIVATMVFFGVALWTADDAAVGTAEERTATLSKASGALHGPLRFGVGIGSALCLWGAGGWCLLVLKDVYEVYSTQRATQREGSEERTDDTPRHRWSVKLRAGVDEAGVEVVLDEIVERFGSFEIYDVHYYPSSDPGAYISYARYDPESRQWQMTLGNHGWSGGIYLIAHGVVVRQLLHLANSTGEVELRSDAAFFAHYQPESPRKNERMNAKLIEIHGAAPM